MLLIGAAAGVFVGDGLTVGVTVGDGVAVGVTVGDGVTVGVTIGAGVAFGVDADEDGADNGGITALLLGLLVAPVSAPVLWVVGTVPGTAWPAEPLGLPAPPPPPEEAAPGPAEFA